MLEASRPNEAGELICAMSTFYGVDLSAVAPAPFPCPLDETETNRALIAFISGRPLNPHQKPIQYYSYQDLVAIWYSAAGHVLVRQG